MVIATSLPVEQPRISSNQLGLFPFQPLNAKLRMLGDQKYGNKITSPYYRSAEAAVLRSFEDGHYNTSVLEDSVADLAHRPAKNPQQKAKWGNNVEMLQNFAAVANLARPPDGEHTVVRRNATIELEGVTISVRPEIVTHLARSGLFAYTKFRFSKNKVSPDASEIILLVLLKYGQQRSGERQIDPQSTRLIDVHAKNIITGHTLPRYREQQLTDALQEIRRLWPTIRRLPGTFNESETGG